MIEILEKGTIYQSENTFSYSAWPTVSTLPDGTIMVVFSGNRAWHICPFGRVLTCKSKDNGRTWTKPETVIDTLLDDRDGGICVFGEKLDKIFITSFTNPPEFQTDLLRGTGMRDNFTHISKELITLNDSYYEYLFSRFDKKEVEDKYLGGTYILSYDGGKTFSDFGLLPISSPHGPTVTKDGSLLYIGKCFDNKEYYGNIKNLGKGFWMYKSKNGKDWTNPKLVLPLTDDGHKYLSEAHAVITESGRILVQIRGNEPNNQGTFQTY